MFGWHENSGIAAVFGIEIVRCNQTQIHCFGTVRIAVILLFRGRDEIVVVLLNSSLLFQKIIQTTFLPSGIA
jgi:hypothetical protein